MDLAILRSKRFEPLEIKWTSQLRAQDFKQIQTYKTGKVLCKNQDAGMFQGLPVHAIWRVLIKEDI